MRKKERITVRVDSSMTENLNEVARLYNTNISTVVTTYLAVCKEVYPILRDSVLKQDTNAKVLENQVRDAIKDSVPDNLNPVIVEMFRQMIDRILTDIVEQLFVEKEGR